MKNKLIFIVLSMLLVSCSSNVDNNLLSDSKTIEEYNLSDTSEDVKGSNSSNIDVSVEYNSSDTSEDVENYDMSYISSLLSDVKDITKSGEIYGTSMTDKNIMIFKTYQDYIEKFKSNKYELEESFFNENIFVVINFYTSSTEKERGIEYKETILKNKTLYLVIAVNDDFEITTEDIRNVFIAVSIPKELDDYVLNYVMMPYDNHSNKYGHSLYYDVSFQ